ncbi:MAG: histidinol-phosphate transaminase [Psychrilyobacter sp.]|uniref:pyridoxal phosphate-dependent aminotransferase n=1 Tax=Psychrilyobacter sp. TaxID=2586924 RepID=UPI003C782FA8
MELHGGNIYKLKREKGLEVLDYSANINPMGLSDRLKKEIGKNLSVLEKYPDPDYLEMKEVIARHNKVEVENIIVGNGATEIMFLYAKNLKPKKVLIISPTFAEYERALKIVDCEIDYFQLKEEEDFILNIPRLKKTLEDSYDLLVVCNPNNPTGKFIDKVILDDLAISCKYKGISILLDEAFIEFVDGSMDRSLVEYKHKNVFIVRALTKFFAIPGLRLGYGITFNEELKGRIEKNREPWSVNAIAELATKVLLEDSEYIKKSETWIKEEKKFMYHELEKIICVRPYITETNFILVKLMTGMKVKEFRKKMVTLGVLVRDASNFNYLDDKYFRLAIKDRRNNIKVLRCVEDAIK